MDKNFNKSLCEVDGQQQDLQAIKDLQKVLDREQQAMKDRIEDIVSRFEGYQEENVKVSTVDLTLNSCHVLNHICSKTWFYVKEKPQDMKSLLDFLDQNKDLMETLGPEVNKLKEMQERVEEKINKLTGRVDQLEKVKHGKKI